MSLDYSTNTKKFNVGTKQGLNAGVTVTEQSAVLTGENKRAFVGAMDDVVNIGGTQLNMQFGPGQVKWMGGLFQSTPFPLSLLPMAPPIMLDPSIIKMGVSVGEQLFTMLSIF